MLKAALPGTFGGASGRTQGADLGASMIRAMKPTRSWPTLRPLLPGRGLGAQTSAQTGAQLGTLTRALQRGLKRWWQTLHGGALLLVLALSPSSYARAYRPALAQQLYFATLPVLPGFAVLAALISLVLIRIVVVTASSYGLSHYAIEMVVRVLVLELIPLSAALYVALRCTLPGAAALAVLRASGGFDALRRAGVDPIRRELLPRVVAGGFAVLLFAAVACALATLLTYLAVYGATLAALPRFTRILGQIFNPGVVLIFTLKSALLSAAVALIPVVALLREARPSRAGTELNSLVRLFSVVLLIEALSLIGNYH